MSDDEPDDYESRPSKSLRKRNAHDAQDLGEELIHLKDVDIKIFDLPEPLYDAIVLARKLTSRAGLVRQRQYIGKLMRGIDLEPIRAVLNARGEKAAQETQRFKRVEVWRDRLMAEGAPAVDQLMQWRPGMDRDEWLRRVAAATAERERLGAAGPASRELFRQLRALLDRATIPE
ncbi:MAG TPA: ribosome biogenesis factor YjgA [Steroidobacteraceae bacterium]|jgi:ribosome-associated protein|nr:ribosome biogenesis factor YjgA [Steroidobacteraceae bacterium]